MSTIPKTLFLEGVFLNDRMTLDQLFNDFEENGIDSNSSSKSYKDIINDNEDIIYDKLPNVFTSLDKWPKKTNTKCHNCSLNITEIPIPIPVSVEINKNNERIFDVKYICCTFVCGATLITHRISNKSTRWEMLSMLKMIRNIFQIHNYFKSHSYNSNLSNIVEKSNISPDNIIRIKNNEIPIGMYKEEMCQYMGNLSREEFKYKINQLEFLQLIDN